MGKITIISNGHKSSMNFEGLNAMEVLGLLRYYEKQIWLKLANNKEVKSDFESKYIIGQEITFMIGDSVPNIIKGLFIKEQESGIIEFKVVSDNYDQLKKGDITFLSKEYIKITNH